MGKYSACSSLNLNCKIIFLYMPKTLDLPDLACSLEEFDVMAVDEATLVVETTA